MPGNLAEPTPRPSSVEDWRAAEIEQERRTNRQLQRRLERLADFIVEHDHVWNYCDGEGGGVVKLLHEALRARGFEPQPWSSMPKAPNPRRPFSDRTRTRIYERDGYACQECGARKELAIDHIVPVARGGTNDEENLRTLCRLCNSRKGARPLAAENA